MSSTTMRAMDTISGALATAYITINGIRYNLMQLHSFEAKMTIKNTEVAILGRTGKGSKPDGWTGTWKGSAYYNQSVLREMWLEYKRSGIMPTMDIQIINEDVSSAAYKQIVLLKDCLSTGGVIAKLDANSQTLSEDIEGTFDDWEMPTKFNLINGMGA